MEGFDECVICGNLRIDVRAVVANQNAQQLGQQLVTILGTLVTAIAAFYFGATSVASANRPEGGTIPGAVTPSGDAPVRPTGLGRPPTAGAVEGVEARIPREGAPSAQTSANDAQHLLAAARQKRLRDRKASQPPPGPH